MSRTAGHILPEQLTMARAHSRFLWTVIVLLIIAALGLLVATGYTAWVVYLRTAG